ncbi:MAG: asparagine synthase (glutamine-hydrolyzing) [Candidatus Bathyarchaeota archaeon]|nr:asparagine synthase (glutamine-hydrolyzing) [Candidatus Bathyarchaeota archaeon]MCZ2845642.1 asparagine synthase (glutamine-hydrolyzing) [Candidatus Bathyarchaeota archaeon]
MCGINGFNFIDKKLIESMNSAIKHRGPDDEGIFTDRNISLGNVRLSVLDLSKAGRQPMTYKHRNRLVTIVHNGEVYNFLEIKKRLEKKGYEFKSRTDTEVILASYIEWGYKCVNNFNGMWAFVIYDPAKNLFFCSRDRLGQKPFYYYFDGKKFIFSSELKGIIKHKYLRLNQKEKINKEALELYFALGFIPSPYTIYTNTFKLEPRQSLIFNLDSKKIKKWFYYKIPKYNPINDSRKLIEEGRNLLKDAVRLRMISDVPIGALLSGGLDSSTTVGFMKELTDIKNLHTFSIGFEGEYDETPFITIVKEYFNTNHHQYQFTERDFEELIEIYSFIYDEPLSDSSGFPTYKLCKKAREYITVALSGDGGDEIFGGYHEHIVGYRMDFIRKIPKFLRLLLSKIPAKRNLNNYASLFLLKKAFKASLYDPTLFFIKALEGEIFLPEVFRNWTIKKMRDCNKYNVDSIAEAFRLYDMLYNTLPDNYLAKVDRASMAEALEVRSPFLDYRFIEFSQKIPTKWKTDLFHTKILMRDIIKGILPNEIIYRSKQGFVPPLQEWILNKKHESFLLHSLDLLKDLSPELYFFLKDKALKEKNKLYGRYKIRLFLFGKWMEKWIKSV